MGKLGLEMIKSYPDILPQKIKNEITIKSMPFGAKDGDFSSITISEDYYFNSYIFQCPDLESDRDNIVSIIAVFDSMEYNPEAVKNFFSQLIEIMKKPNECTSDYISSILSKIYKGIGNGELKLRNKEGKKVVLKINFFKKTPKKQLETLKDDIWT